MVIDATTWYEPPVAEARRLLLQQDIECASRAAGTWNEAVTVKDDDEEKERTEDVLLEDNDDDDIEEIVR